MRTKVRETRLRHVTGAASRLREEVRCGHSRTRRIRAPCHDRTLRLLHRRHCTFGRIGHVAGGDHANTALGQHLLPQLDIGAFQPHD